jgi:hypothetical protein
VPLIDLLLPQDSGAADQIGDLVETIGIYLYVGLAFGLTALRSGRLASIAAGLLLFDVLGPPLVSILDVPLGAEVLLCNHVLAVGVFGAALVSKRSVIGWGLAVLAVVGGVLFAWSGWTGSEVMEGVGQASTAVAFAALFELLRRAPWPEQAVSTLGAWRTADEGARLVIMGERGRLVILAVAFLGGLLLRAVNADAALLWIVTLGQVLIIAFSTVGFATMRDAPVGRVWVLAGLGMALLALGSGVNEVLAMALDLHGYLVGTPNIGRIVGHFALAALAALALGALGKRAGLPHSADEGRRTAWLYVGLFALTYITLVARDFEAPKGLLAIVGITVIVVMVVAVRRLAALGGDVRKALPAGAAEDVFGDEAAPGQRPTSEG